MELVSYQSGHKRIFDRPPYFHVGCDEADNVATCRKYLRRKVKTLIWEHICFFHKLFAERNTRIIMRHDMLVTSETTRWKGYTACGLPQDELDELL